LFPNKKVLLVKIDLHKMNGSIVAKPYIYW